MRMLGSLLAFVLLVLTAHCAIFALNPGIADVRAASPGPVTSATHR